MLTQEQIDQIIESECNINEFIAQVLDNLPDEFDISINFQPVIKVVNGQLENKKSLSLVFCNNTTVDFTYLDVTPELTPKDVADKILKEHNEFLQTHD